MSTVLALVTASPAAADTAVAVPMSVNFQAQTTTTPAGYLGDYGQAYDATRGYGWVDGSGAPLSLVGNGRERGALSDKRIDTFMHMQLPAGSAGVSTPGSWKATIANGTYTVTVAVGDPLYIDSHHVVRVQGQTAVDFTPTSAQTNQSGTVTVTVTTGVLTLDAVGGTNTKIDYLQIQPVAPRVIAVQPTAGATGVTLDSAVTVQLSDGADPSTANAAGVQLLNAAGSQITGFYNTDGAYSNVTFVPSANLQANSTYTIKVTSALKAPSGAAYQPFSSTFTTGTGLSQPPTGLSFTKTVFDVGDGTNGTSNTAGPTAMALGPDGRLYVAFGTGDILAYPLDTLGRRSGTPTDITAFKLNRIVTGLRFDPAATASNLILWVSNGQFGCDLAVTGTACDDFTGALSKLTGTSAATLVRTDVVTGLPRSVGNHLNNGLDFGPDGAIYLAQGANNGYGAPDATWGNRAEDPLSAAILRIDQANITTTPYNVNTSTGYNPNVTGARVTVYASGTRNPFSVVWHSNGKLYAPVNESANGNTPADPAGGAPALSNLTAFNDYFTQIVQGGYYGHPNPARGQYRLNGGNPTSGTDPFDVPQYPVGTTPNATWRQPDLNLGLHRSPDGSVEYRSNAFGGALRGQLLVTEYSQGKDVIAVKLDASGKPISRSVVMSGFNNPLPITSDPSSGRVYVGEFGRDPDGAGGQITLLTPAAVSQTTAHVNFQSQTAVPPSGYVADYGVAFSTSQGFGWQDGTGAPYDRVGLGRERNLVADKRLDTFMHMQAPSSSGDATPGRWELAVPNGTYSVTVGVGDPGYSDSRDVLNAEGTRIVDFTPTSTTTQTTATALVTVNDGRLTIDANGGTNTKIDFIDVTPPSSTPPVTVTSPDDLLGLPTRLVFSTVLSAARPGKAVTVHNNSSSTVNVASLTISGTDGYEFKLDPSQPTSFTIPAGGMANVLVNFRPTDSKVVDNLGSLVITYAGGSTSSVVLSGLNAIGYEDTNEPSAQQIFDTLGYGTNAGVTNTVKKNYISNARTPVGDEIVSGYWKRVDGSRPIGVAPVAAFSGRQSAPTGPVDWYTEGTPGTQNHLFSIPGGTDVSGGQNQRLLPSLTSGSVTAFNTATPFGLHESEKDYSDDGLGSGKLHDMRWYPAKTTAGVVIPNTWLVADDVGQDPAPASGKNWDYQDWVLLVTNAQPEFPAGAAPGSSTLNMDFSSARSGTIADKAGLGTGFTNVQANSAGNQYAPGNLTLDTATGRLTVLTTSGTNTNTVNTQLNALQCAVDATLSKFQVQSRFVGPFSALDAGSEQQAIYFGYDQDNYFKVEVEHQGDGFQHLTLFMERGGVGSIVTSIRFTATSAATLDLFVTADPNAGTLQAAYRISSNNAADIVALGSPVVVPDLMRWFNRQSFAGIMANSSDGGSPFSATFDSFSVVAA